jgi:prophage antirepressor-like protein
MDFKKFRTDRAFTQVQAGALIGMSASYWCTLEAGKIDADHVAAFARVLKYIDNPMLDLPLTPERMASVRAYGLTMTQASQMIGAGRSSWSNLATGHLEKNTRWTRLANALLIELKEKEDAIKKQAELDLTPGGEIEVLIPHVLTPEREAPVVEVEINDKSLVPFEYQNQPVRCKSHNQEAWLCVRDICAIIGHKNSRDALSLIDDEEVAVFDTLTSGGVQKTTFTTYTGMLQLLTRTRVEGAKPFQNWVYREVLPAVMQTGQYQAAPVDPIDAAILSLQRIKQIEAHQAQLTATIEAQAQQIEQIKLQAPVDTDKAVNQTLQKLQSLEARRNELHNLVAQVVNAADRSKHIIASSYCNYQSVWRAVFNASNPPVNKLAGYTSLAQINTGITAAKQLLETLEGKAPAEQLKIDVEGDAA